MCRHPRSGSRSLASHQTSVLQLSQFFQCCSDRTGEEPHESQMLANMNKAAHARMERRVQRRIVTRVTTGIDLMGGIHVTLACRHFTWRVANHHRPLHVVVPNVSATIISLVSCVSVGADLD